MNSAAGKLLFVVLLSILFFANNFVLFVLAYVFVSLGMLVHALLTKNDIKNKILLSMIYVAVMIFQLTHNALITFAENAPPFISLRSRIVAIVLAAIPFIIYGMTLGNKNIKRYLPSIQDLTVFTFNELTENINSVKEIINKGYKTITKGNIDELLKDLPRHNSFRYINKGSLTGEYFELAYGTLRDKNIYIIISNTGSPASEIISLFTRKQYNHASLSFDRNLKTIISYNGGERLYPPGLNMEMVKYFNRKKDASIIVYSIPITPEKKNEIIDTVREINKQGNAYNLFGLIFKFSFKPNIMFCSQFVYKMLKTADLHYFEKKENEIRPTDFVEMDYYRKLKYEYEIKFNEKPIRLNCAYRAPPEIPKIVV